MTNATFSCNLMEKMPQTQRCVKDGHPLHSSVGSFTAATGGTVRSRPAPQRVTWYFPPHLLFVVFPRRDDLYYRGWEIKDGFSHSDPVKLASRTPRESALIYCTTAALPSEKKSVGVAGLAHTKTQLLFSRSSFQYS